VDLVELEQLGADDSRVRTIARWMLGGILLVAGVAHLTSQRVNFQAQVPSWFPLDNDVVVLASGVVELALGAALIALRRHRVLVGVFVAVFFVAVFPGNIAQWTDGTDAFGLDTDSKRFVRLLFQPVLVVWAAWASGASGLLIRRR
jgi:uncharacterized membrane protein